MDAAIRLLRPAPGVLAFYAGRDGSGDVEGDWVDESLALGVASYAIVDGEEALVYDTGLSPAHGERIRAAVEAAGARRITVLLSHWHLDHVAGTAAFPGCEVLTTARTAERLAGHRAAIEAGELEGPPPISPLVMPTRTFEGRTEIAVGSRRLEAIHVDVHSDDAAVLWDPAARLLLAGDTVEDPATYVDEPGSLAAHLGDLERLAGLAPAAILPAHGDPERIAGGGYGPGLIEATAAYLRFLLRCREEPAPRERTLAELLEGELSGFGLEYFEPYEAVHRHNLAAVA